MAKIYIDLGNFEELVEGFESTQVPIDVLINIQEVTRILQNLNNLNKISQVEATEITNHVTDGMIEVALLTQNVCKIRTTLESNYENEHLFQVDNVDELVEKDQELFIENKLSKLFTKDMTLVHLHEEDDF